LWVGVLLLSVFGGLVVLGVLEVWSDVLFLLCGWVGGVVGGGAGGWCCFAVLGLGLGASRGMGVVVMARASLSTVAATWPGVV
ncbi:hypothetical protein RA265_28895, partial [Pseudomonas syringae pv. tagetis]